MQPKNQVALFNKLVTQLHLMDNLEDLSEGKQVNICYQSHASLSIPFEWPAPTGPLAKKCLPATGGRCLSQQDL